MRKNRTYNGLGGFSGHASSMISSIKTNFRKKDLILLKGSRNKVTYKKVEFNKKPTLNQLIEIREKLQVKNRKYLLKNSITFSILMIIVIYVIGFVKF